MDLKALLLQSTSTTRTLRYIVRLHFGKRCYSIEYEVKGKFLSVKNIKKHPKFSLELRIRNRARLLRKFMPCRGKSSGVKMHVDSRESETQTSCHDITNVDKKVIELKQSESQTESEIHHELRDSEMQTTTTTLCCTATETDSPGRISKEQQTKKPLVLIQSVQTDMSSGATRTTQTDCSNTRTCSSQVENSAFSVGVQVQNEYCSTLVQTEQVETVEKLKEDRDTVKWMISEIGGLLLNQNQVLHNNSTLLGQLSEITLLNQKVAIDKSMKKHCKKIQQRKRNVRHRKYRHKCGPIVSKAVERSDKYIQTDKIPQVVMKHVLIQTSDEFIKKKKIAKFFKNYISK